MELRDLKTPYLPSYGLADGVNLSTIVFSILGRVGYSNFKFLGHILNIFPGDVGIQWLRGLAHDYVLTEVRTRYNYHMTRKGALNPYTVHPKP